MQKKATPIREGVVLIKENHTADDLFRLGQRLQERFGIKLIQAYTHKDEGHWEKGKWHPNLHGHMVFDWTDEYGKSIKLNRYQMCDMQTLVAEELEMERGIPSDRTHLSAIAFKVQEEEKRLLKIKSEIKEFSNLKEEELIHYKDNDILEFLGFKREIDYPTTLSTYKKSLKSTQMEVKEKTKLIEFWVEIILKQYAERLEKLMKSYAQEHQKVLELDTSYFNTLSHGLKSGLIVEYYGSIQDLKEEVFLKFEEQKQKHSQKVYNKVLEEYQKYQTLQEKLQNQQQTRIKKGRRL